MNRTLYWIVILALIITTVSQTVSFIVGDHQFYETVQDKCTKCHGDIQIQLSTSDQHSNFSCTTCHARSATNHTNKNPECSYCHAASGINDSLEAHPGFSSLGSEGCIACHSTYNVMVNYSRPEYIDYTITNSGGIWIVSDFKTQGTLNLSYDAMRQGGKHNIKTVSCKDCHKDIFEAVSLGGHAVIIAKNGTQASYHNNSNSTPEEWCRTCHNKNDTKFQTQQHSARKTTCEECHESNNLTIHPGDFYTNIKTVPHLYQSLVCISCKSAGWPTPNISLSFMVHEEPYYDVSYQTINPLSITDSSPTSDPITTAGVSQMFSVTLNRFADIVWYNNGYEVFRVLSVISASYTDSKTIPGVYDIKAVASDNYNSAPRIWVWNVTNGSGGGDPGVGGGGGGSGGGIGNGTSNNISGYVFDNFGLPLPGVLVQNGSYQNITSDSGYYSITNIPNGEYNFTYSLSGYDSDYFIFILNGVDIAANKYLYDTTPPNSISNTNSITGNFWINNTWINPSDPDYNYTIFRYENGSTLQTVNNSTNYLNLTLSPHYIQNITAQTSDIFNKINETCVWFNATIANNFPVQLPITNRTIYEGQYLNFTVNASDADNDTIVYGTDATKGTLNSITGEFSWMPIIGDSGTYFWNFNSSDPYGGVSDEIITIIVTETLPTNYIPPVPFNLSSTQGNFWINHTWEPGTGNVTDSYNVLVNDIWANGTSNNYIYTTVLPHGWSNITVYAYNATGPGTLNSTSLSDNTQVVNNVPVQAAIGNKEVIAGDWLNLSISTTDADNDIIIYATDATNGLFNIVTGEYSWQTSITDVGIYIWNFNSSDPYGGVSNEAIIITVTETLSSNYIPPVPINLSSTQGNFWINHIWEPGTGNVTDSYNVLVNDIWTNGTSNTYKNTTVLPHGWSNITVYAFNSSSTGTLNSTSISNNTQVANNVPVQAAIGNKEVIAGNWLNISINTTDADNDPIIYGTNATNGTLNITTGEYTWQTSITDAGTYIWNFNSSDPYGAVSNEIINIIVTETLSPNYIPPAPFNLSSTQGNFWINHTWEPGIGNVTDSYNILVNDIWTNGTSNTYINTTVLPHGWSNITVYAYNATGSGTLNSTSISTNTQVANNVPVQAAIGNKEVFAGDWLNISISTADADNDPIIYGTNATNGSLNITTGEYSWQTNITDVGTYTWNFNSSDPYGGVSNETITIIVTDTLPTNYIPPVPINLNNTMGNFWINHTWEAGTGNVTDSYNVLVNDIWTNGTGNTYNNTTVLPHGWSNITVYAYNASGQGSLNSTSISTNTQVANNEPVQAAIGNKEVFAGNWLNISINTIDADNDPIIYSTNATNGTLNITTGEYSWQTSITDAGTYTWNFNSSDPYGAIVNETITITVTETLSSNYIPPVPFNLSSTQGNFWINHTWEPGTGNVTDSYNVLVNDIWTNGTGNTYNNTTVLPHGWSNITVYAYNATGTGTLNSTSISNNTQIVNNVPVQAAIGNKEIIAGNWLNISISTTDADNDPIIYGTNATSGSFNITTGEYTWQTSITDVGTYIWNFNSSDPYGGISNETITIIVTDTLPTNYIPPVPINMSSTQGNFWINHTWEPGTGNVTDSYNVLVNDIWTNGTSNTYNNTTVLPHGWSNITVYAYNATGSGTLNSTSISTNTQVANNVPVQAAIGNKEVFAGNWLNISISTTDADNDPIIYGTNATNGSLNITTGEYSWQTNITDVGTYTWNFNSSDPYGGVANETITITVTETLSSNYIPPVPFNLSSTQGNFWINHTWEPGIGNVTDSYNVLVNDIWTNGTGNTYNNTTVLPHGWSNITVYAYNASGQSILNSISISTNTQLANNMPVQAVIGNKEVIAGNWLNISINTADADNDPIIYGTNATGTLTGYNYSWLPTELDVGTYYRYFNSSDNYGATTTETITITVKSMPVYNVSGYVFDNFGSGSGGVLVQNGSNQNTTSASGYYSITNLTDGTHNFSYSKAGFNTDHLEITINGADNTSANMTIYDTTSPAGINTIVAVSTPLSINWTWTDPSDPDLDHVEVYVDGAFKTNATKGVEFYNASYFEPNSTHMISTRTVDYYGNVNSTWVNDTVITPSVFTYVFDFLNNTGTVTSFGDARNADGAVSTYAEVQAVGENKSNRTMNPVKTITNGTQNNTYSSSYLDNLDGLIDGTIPAVSGTSETIYLVNTVKTGLGGTTYWNLNATSGGASNTATNIVISGTANRRYVFRPGAQNNKITGTPGTSPAGYGWASNTPINGITGVGVWSFQVRTTSTITGRIGTVLAYVYKYNATSGVNTYLFSANGTYNHLNNASTTEVINSAVQLSYKFNSTEYLKVEYWLNVTTTTNNAVIGFESNTATQYVRYPRNNYSLNSTYSFTESNSSSTWQSIVIKDNSYGDSLTNVSILNSTSGHWESILSSGFAGGSTLSQHVNVIKGESGNASYYDAGSGLIKIRYNWTGAGFNNSLGIDLLNVTVNYLASYPYRLNITTNTTEIPESSNHELQLRYNVSGDDFILQLWNGSSWNNRTILNDSIISYRNITLLPDELISYGTMSGNAGSINKSYANVRYLDSNASATQQGSIYLDYQRIYSN